jgi:ribulose-phosphate 3-epimerase
MNIHIIPSLIAQDQKQFDKIYSKIKVSPTIHLDVMDGEYVGNKSLWFPFQLPTHDYEAHLMTTKPEMFIGKHNSNIKTFIVHVETTSNVDALIEFVHSMRCRIFLALKPSIPVSAIRRYLKRIDGVLVMTVQPGKYGAPFMRNMIGKIRQLRNMNRNLTIEVDGSVNDKTIKLLKEAGANRFSVGSYIQKSKDVKNAINELLKA